MLLWRILRDSFAFFDRRWKVIILAALLSLGIAEAISLSIRFLAPLPGLGLVGADGKPIDITYNDVIEVGLFFFAKIWFDAFVGYTARSELAGEETGFSKIAHTAFSKYGRILMVNFVAQMIMNASLLLAIPGLTLGPLGILFLVPAVLFLVWFSLVTPVIVFTDEEKIGRVLLRSRATVFGFFGTVFFALIISTVLPFATFGIPASSQFFWPVTVFFNSAAALIGALITVYTYIHIRLVQSYYEMKQEEEAAD